MKCAACSRRMRRGVRALVLGIGGNARRGRVCLSCQRNGWLLVLGDDRADGGRGAAPRVSPFVRELLGQGGAPPTVEEMRADVENLRKRTSPGALPTPHPSEPEKDREL